MCTEHNNFELPGRENMKSHIYVLIITEGKYAWGPWVSAQMSPGRRNQDGKTREESDEVWRYICLKSFNLKNTLIVLHI